MGNVNSTSVPNPQGHRLQTSIVKAKLSTLDKCGVNSFIEILSQLQMIIEVINKLHKNVQNWSCVTYLVKAHCQSFPCYYTRSSVHFSLMLFPACQGQFSSQHSCTSRVRSTLIIVVGLPVPPPLNPAMNTLHWGTFVLPSFFVCVVVSLSNE